MCGRVTNDRYGVSTSRHNSLVMAKILAMSIHRDQPRNRKFFDFVDAVVETQALVRVTVKDAPAVPF
jgi:hypothetical protein